MRGSSEITTYKASKFFGELRWLGILSPTSAIYSSIVVVLISLAEKIPFCWSIAVNDVHNNFSFPLPFTNIGSNPGGLWFGIGVNAFYGEDPTGDWTLEVIDYSEDGTAGTLKGFAIVVYGH